MRLLVTVSVAAASFLSACDTANAPGDAAVPSDMSSSPDMTASSSDMTSPPSDMAIQGEVVDPSIDVPTGNSILLRAYAQGTQNYTCTMAATDGGVSYAWTFVAPAADLFSDPGYTNKIGKHFAGPTWQLTDGSQVMGANPVKWTPPNDTTDIPWLLLQAKPMSGTQQFVKVSYIQRLHTALGKVVAGDLCDSTTIGAMVMKPYTAIYYFWVGP